MRQRIQINCEPINERSFSKAVLDLKPIFDAAATNLPQESPEWERRLPSFFEAMTAIAFYVFSEKNLNFSIIEVGLGGRLDATNVLDPLAAILTPLDLEHTEFLGSTLESVACEKAGIAKRNRPFIIGPQNKEISALLHDKCLEKKAIPCHAEAVADTEILSRQIEGYEFRFPFVWEETKKNQYLLNKSNEGSSFKTPLLGNHQVQNAALALSCVELLERRGLLKQIEKKTLYQGLLKTSWSARTEPFKHSETGSLLIIDAAHTVQASHMLRMTLDELFPERDFFFILGFLEGKRISESVKELVTKRDHLLCVRPSSQRAIPAETLFERVQDVPCATCESIDDLQEALSRAVSSGKIVVVAGSIYLAGEMRSLAIQKEGFTPLRKEFD